MRILCKICYKPITLIDTSLWEVPVAFWKHDRTPKHEGEPVIEQVLDFFVPIDERMI